VTTDEIADRLYGLPPEEFTRARDDAARELRNQGLRAEAAQVKELRRPTAAAAVVNRLVRDHRAGVERFLDAAAALRLAQLEGKGDLAKASRAERDALTKLIAAGGDAVRQSLQAAAVDETAAQELLEGRLERELEPRGFGTLLAEAAASAPRKPKPAPKKPDDRAARAKLHDAESALAAAEAAEKDARARWERATAGVRAAEKAVTKAREQLEKLQAP
jgi:hypothetical protein